MVLVTFREYPPRLNRLLIAIHTVLNESRQHLRLVLFGHEPGA